MAGFNIQKHEVGHLKDVISNFSDSSAFCTRSIWPFRPEQSPPYVPFGTLMCAQNFEPHTVTSQGGSG